VKPRQGLSALQLRRAWPAVAGPQACHRHGRPGTSTISARTPDGRARQRLTARQPNLFTPTRWPGTFP